MTEKEPQKNEEGLEVHKQEVTAMVPGVGFVKTGETSISLGEEEDILNHLRRMGFSEDAITAFRSGKALTAQLTKTVFGTVLENESWIGKDKPQT